MSTTTTAPAPGETDALLHHRNSISAFTGSGYNGPMPPSAVQSRAQQQQQQSMATGTGDGEAIPLLPTTTTTTGGGGGDAQSSSSSQQPQQSAAQSSPTTTQQQPPPPAAAATTTTTTATLDVKRPGDREFSVRDGCAVYLRDAKGREQQFCTNRVIQSRYTAWNFIPKNIFEQFQNLANVYFLFVGVLQMIDSISTTEGIPTMYQPLGFILLVSAARAASEDYSRHKADNERNNYEYDVMTKEGFRPIRAGDIQVGQIVKIKENDMLPCDMLFLGSALPQGHCYIDEANLNGETTLQVVNCCTATQALFRDDASIRRFACQLTYEGAHEEFNACRGYLRITSPSKYRKDDTIDGKILLMRETVLRNCPYVYGLVVYTGQETAIQMSNKSGQNQPVKISYNMRRVQTYLVGMVVAQLALCTLGGLVCMAWVAKNDDMWYLDFQDSAFFTGMLAFFSWFIIMSMMVPISLIVTAEIVKFIQAWFIQSDIDLYYAPINKIGKCNTATLHEDLGLIDYVFSDKTGTLTQNKMTFRYALLAPIIDDDGDGDGDGSGSGSGRKAYEYEFGSMETAIAKAVKVREEELRRRKRAARMGTVAAEAMVRADRAAVVPWTSLEYPFRSPATNSRSRKPVGCCQCLCLHKHWSERRPYVDVKQSIDAGNTEFDIQERRELIGQLWQHRLPSATASGTKAKQKKTKSSSSSSGGDDDDYDRRRRRKNDGNAGNAAAAAAADDDDDDEGGVGNPRVSPRMAKRMRRALQLYLRHMALSNTIKPFIEGKELKFQADSAEELAMVTFARDMGYVKMSENPVHLEIHEFDERLQSIGKVVEVYDHVATFGFTPRRARVTVIYHDVEHQRMLVMLKGQDTVVLPLIQQAYQKEELQQTLTVLSTNGMRTLVCAHAEMSEEWWFDDHNGVSREYQRIIAMDTTEHSKGHSAGQCNSALCEKCHAHDFFESIEQSCSFAYVGLMGMEDQLQALVPNCIQDFLKADIKVWMITGDKLDAAKTIGLACNLIDPDMQPNVGQQASLVECAYALRDARLCEITGRWASLPQNSMEMGRLFDTLDTKKQGYIDYVTFERLVTSLLSSTTTSSSTSVTYTGDGNVPPPSSALRMQIQTLLLDGRGGDINRIDRRRFVTMMRDHVHITPYDAVAYDLAQGWSRYRSIVNHETYPISLLISRDAFLVLFPEDQSDDQKAKAAKAVKATNDADSKQNKKNVLQKMGVMRHKSAQQLRVEALRDRFFALAAVSKSVVFARAKPAHKMRMVAEIKERVAGCTTLAVGDGANDTDMITAAHIGVGISGVEGTAAVNAADYAIGTFRMLHTLLFVHGTWSYMRISRMIVFLFYKASLTGTVMYFFGTYSGFSGQQWFNDPPYQLFNVMFTALPVMFIGILDQVLPRHVLQNNPEIYRYQKHAIFTTTYFVSWVIRAFLHGAILFYLPVWSLGRHDIEEDGWTRAMWFVSTCSFLATALTPTFLSLFLMNSITTFHWISIILSILAIFTFVSLLSLMIEYNPNLYGVVHYMWQSRGLIYTLVLSVSIPLLLEAIWLSLRRSYAPYVYEIYQERNTSEYLVMMQQQQQQQQQREREQRQQQQRQQQQSSSSVVATTTPTMMTTTSIDPDPQRLSASQRQKMRAASRASKRRHAAAVAGDDGDDGDGGGGGGGDNRNGNGNGNGNNTTPTGMVDDKDILCALLRFRQLTADVYEASHRSGVSSGKHASSSSGSSSSSQHKGDRNDANDANNNDDDDDAADVVVEVVRMHSVTHRTMALEHTTTSHGGGARGDDDDDDDDGGGISTDDITVVTEQQQQQQQQLVAVGNEEMIAQIVSSEPMMKTTATLPTTTTTTTTTVSGGGGGGGDNDNDTIATTNAQRAVETDSTPSSSTTYNTTTTTTTTGGGEAGVPPQQQPSSSSSSSSSSYNTMVNNRQHLTSSSSSSSPTSPSSPSSAAAVAAPYGYYDNGRPRTRPASRQQQQQQSTSSSLHQRQSPTPTHTTTTTTTTTTTPSPSPSPYRSLNGSPLQHQHQRQQQQQQRSTTFTSSTSPTSTSSTPTTSRYDNGLLRTTSSRTTSSSPSTSTSTSPHHHHIVTAIHRSRTTTPRGHRIAKHHHTFNLDDDDDVDVDVDVNDTGVDGGTRGRGGARGGARGGMPPLSSTSRTRGGGARRVGSPTSSSSSSSAASASSSSASSSSSSVKRSNTTSVLSSSTSSTSTPSSKPTTPSKPTRPADLYNLL